MQLILNYCAIVDVFEAEPKKADDQKKNRQVKIYVDEEDFFQMLEMEAIKVDKYLQAEMQLILSSKQNTERWLIDNETIYFINHKRDKKNKLISVEATFDKPNKK